MDTSSLMEQILSRENLNAAYLQVVSNKGAAGVAGMEYTELKNYLSENSENGENIRYRLRMCIWKHWKTPQNRAENLIKLGISRKYAWSTAYTGARIAYICQRGAMNIAVTKEKLTRFGLVSMLDYYTERCVSC